jgi:hypothetical protein
VAIQQQQRMERRLQEVHAGLAVVLPFYIAHICLSLLSRRSQLRVCLTKVIYGQELARRSRLSGPVILAESNTRVYKILGTFYPA